MIVLGQTVVVLIANNRQEHAGLIKGKHTPIVNTNCAGKDCQRNRID